MKKIGLIVAVLLLVGAGCANSAPAEVAKKTGNVVVSGQITSETTGSFVVEAGTPKEKTTIVYDSNTRFAEPDGSGIGGPIAKPQIDPGLEVEVQGVWQEDATVKADNIIFNAE